MRHTIMSLLGKGEKKLNSFRIYMISILVRQNKGED